MRTLHLAARWSAWDGIKKSGKIVEWQNARHRTDLTPWQNCTTKMWVHWHFFSQYIFRAAECIIILGNYPFYSTQITSRLPNWKLGKNRIFLNCWKFKKVMRTENGLWPKFMGLKYVWLGREGVHFWSIFTLKKWKIKKGQLQSTQITVGFFELRGFL